MSHSSFILFPHDATWRVGIVDAGGTPRFEDAPLAASPAESALHIADHLRSAGYRGEGVMLAIPSDWCLATRIAVKDLPKRDRSAMIFRLEEKLPLAAEEFVADFIIPDR